MYKCEICGKEYDNLKDRANCEWRCSNKLEFEGEQHKKEILREEKKIRADEVNKAYNEYQKLYNKYIDDFSDNSFSLRDPLRIFFGI